MLTVNDVARRWRMTPDAVRRRIASGALPATRLEARFRLAWPDVLAQEVPSCPSAPSPDRYSEPLLTRADVAGAMGVTVRTVERWIREGLPVRRIGKKVRLDPRDAANWLRKRFGVEAAFEGGAPRLPLRPGRRP